MSEGSGRKPLAERSALYIIQLRGLNPLCLTRTYQARIYCTKNINSLLLDCNRSGKRMTIAIIRFQGSAIPVPDSQRFSKLHAVRRKKRFTGLLLWPWVENALICTGTPYAFCGGKTSLERENARSIGCASFFVYFLTMASRTRCEIMNSEVAGSILTVIRVKVNKGTIPCSRTCKTHQLKTTIRAI